MSRPAMPFGADVSAERVHFALYAPTAKSVDLVIGGASPQPMTRADDGFYAFDAKGIGADARYRYCIDGNLLVPDPASRAQPDGIDKDGVVVDSRAYAWRVKEWRGRPWHEAVIYEVHVGTATLDGTFTALAERLPDLAALGITAIQLMPVADCPGTRNWGYDGVLLFAPNNAYGTPDDLRGLVDRAHELGLMVFLDVVYNHFGPAGNYLHAYANSFFTERHPTPWGAGINVDGEGAKPVREFIVQNVLYWLDEFRMDGLRFDAVHALRDDSTPHILSEIATRARAAFPDRHIHLILENEENAARWLARGESGGAELHSAQWNDDIHHCLHVLLTGEHDAYYADFADNPLARLGRALAEGFVYQGEMSGNLRHVRGEPSTHLPPLAFVSFLQNHDQVGNRALGERISALASPEKVRLAHEILLLAPQVPMLFMGEEWDASTPFQFFVDFSVDPGLSKAVRDGRRKEFARFAAFADPEQVPDPTALETFQRSKLRWDERAREPHSGALAATKALLAIRKREIVALLATPFLGATRECQNGLLDVVWRFRAGELRMIVNVSEEQQTVDVAGWRIIQGEADARIAPWSCTVAVKHDG